MRNPILAIAIAFVVAAPCTVASAQSYQAYVKTEATKQGKFKGGDAATHKSAPPNHTRMEHLHE